MGSYDKDISSYVDGTRVKISYADGKTEELVFDDSDSVETSRGDEVRAEIVTDMENECPVGAAQIRIYTLYSEDSYAYDIEIKDIEDVAVGSLAEGSNQVSLSENGSVYYTFKPSTSARYTFAPVGGMEIYSKIDADDETMYDLKKLSVSDGEAALDASMSLAEDIITANTDLQAFFCINDPSALGAAAAVKAANKTGKIGVYSIDASPDGKQALIDGEFTAVACQVPVQIAEYAFNAAQKYVGGDTTIDEKKVYLDSHLVLKDEAEKTVNDWQ